jgi:hypothetical protein
LEWLQDSSQTNGDKLNVRRETNRNFRDKMKKYLKDKINEFATYIKNKYVRDRGINEFKKGDHQELTW